MFKYESVIYLFFKIGNISIKFKKKTWNFLIHLEKLSDIMIKKFYSHINMKIWSIFKDEILLKYLKFSKNWCKGFILLSQSEISIYIHLEQDFFEIILLMHRNIIWTLKKFIELNTKWSLLIIFIKKNYFLKN